MTDQNPSREDLGRAVCDIAVDWSSEDWTRRGGNVTWDTLTDELRDLYMRIGEGLFRQGQSSPLRGECSNCQHGAAHHENSGCYGVCGNYTPSPLPEGETAFPAEVQSKIDETKVRVEAMAKVVHTLAVVVSKSNRPDMAGWLAEVAIAITTGREWPTLDALSPLPADETEWEWGNRWPRTGVVQQLGTRAEAEAYRMTGTELVRRRVSAWVEVKQS